MDEQQQICSVCETVIPEEIAFGLCPVCCLGSLGDHSSGRDSSQNKKPNITGVEIIKSIGEGAFGQVYQGIETQGAERIVAIKLLNVAQLNPESITRFNQEIQNVSYLEHTHIARFYSSGLTEEGNPYYTMELVDGVDLGNWYKNATNEDKLAVMIQITSAVKYAHQHGIAHRDLKPNNILISITDEGPLAKVIDFGLSRAYLGTASWTREATMLGQRMGTPLYMSPEQIEGSPDLDMRTDIWALGLLIYELALGRPLLEGVIRSSVSWSENLSKLKHFVLPKLADKELEWIGRKACKYSPDNRYQSVYALLKDLKAKAAGELVSVGKSYWKYRVSKFVLRNKMKVIFALVCVFCFVILASSGWIVSQHEKKANDATQKLLEQEIQTREKLETSHQILKRKSSDTALLAGIRSLFVGDYDHAKQQLAQAELLWNDNITAKYVSAYLRGTLPYAKKVEVEQEIDSIAGVVAYSEGFVLTSSSGEKWYLDHKGELNEIDLATSLDLKIEPHEKMNSIEVVRQKVGCLEFISKDTGVPLLHPLTYGSGSEQAFFNPRSMRVLVVGNGMRLWDVSGVTTSMETISLHVIPHWAGFEKNTDRVWIIDDQKILYKWQPNASISPVLRMNFLSDKFDRWKLGEGNSTDLGDSNTGVKGVLQLCAWSQWVVLEKHYVTSIVKARKTADKLVSTSNGKLFYQQSNAFYQHIYGVSGTPITVAIEANARCAAIYTSSGVVQIVDFEKEQVVSTWKITSPATGITIPDGGEVIVIAHNNGQISIRDRSSGRLVLPVVEVTDSLTEGERVNIKSVPTKKEVLCCVDGNIELRRLSIVTGKWVGKVMRHTKGVDWFCLSDNGDIVFSCDQNGTGKSRLRIWSLRLGVEIIPSIPHADQITWVAIIDGGGRILTCCRDKLIRIWSNESK